MLPRLTFMAATTVVALAGVLLAPAGARAADPLASNCVLFARSKVPSLPTGLFTQADKARIINSYTPKVGSVAVHSYNHVSVVTVTESIKRPSGTYTVVTISESNYKAGQYTTRRGTPDSLGIVGYFKP